MRNQLLTKLLWLSFSFGIALGFDPSNYANSSQLSDTFKIYWTIDSGQIFLALQGDTMGWVGFGIGEPTSGSMPGADIITGAVSDAGVVSIGDRYATDFVTPQLDSCQDWVLIAGEMTSDGRTIVEVSRLLDTKDPQDRAIVAGQNRIVWAWGENDQVTYHDSNRGDLTFTFFGETQQPTQSGSFTQQYSLQGTPVPTKTTTYLARTFPFPVDRDYHIVEIAASISVSLVHETVLYGCTNNSAWVQAHLNTSLEVYTSSDVVPPECLNTLWAWTTDMAPLVLPQATGFRVSATQGLSYLLVLTHYNNPDGVLTVDNSFFTFSLTPQLRTHDAAVLQIGDPLIALTTLIPARAEATLFEFSCASDCTSQWEHDITVWGSFLYMRNQGQKAYSSQFRSTALGPINTVEFYDVDYAQVTPVNRIVQKGDRLNTNCVYNTANKLDTTSFGLSFTQEICVNYLFYYPKLQSRPYCGYYQDSLKNYSLCSATNIIDERNPTAFDDLIDDSFGIPGNCVSTEGQSSQVVVVMKVSVPAMFGVCLLSAIITVGMIAGLLMIALRTKDPSLENKHHQISEEEH